MGWFKKKINQGHGNLNKNMSLNILCEHVCWLRDSRRGSGRMTEGIIA